MHASQTFSNFAAPWRKLFSNNWLRCFFCLQRYAFYASYAAILQAGGSPALVAEQAMTDQQRRLADRTPIASPLCNTLYVCDHYYTHVSIPVNSLSEWSARRLPRSTDRRAPAIQSSLDQIQRAADARGRLFHDVL